MAAWTRSSPVVDRCADSCSAAAEFHCRRFSRQISNGRNWAAVEAFPRQMHERRSAMQVSEVMSSDVNIASPDQTIREAASLMADIDAGALPVGENDRLVGMITDRDIVIRAVAQGKSPDTKVADVMSKEMLYCFDTDDIDNVGRNMGKAQVRR